MFSKRDKNGKYIRYHEAVIDCSKDKPLTEQSHRDETNINNIVKRHGMDLIAKTAALSTPEYIMDDDPTNDFMEAMLIVTKAQQTFEQLPSELRAKFENQPAKFMDFIHNPENIDQMVEMGLVNAPQPEPSPIQVEVITPTVPDAAPTVEDAPKA